MARRRELCWVAANNAETAVPQNAGERDTYLAIVRTPKLPRKMTRDDWRILFRVRRADRTGLVLLRRDRTRASYAVHTAVHEIKYCCTHDCDERILQITGSNIDRLDGEAGLPQRFVQGVAEAPHSSHWHEPKLRTTRRLPAARRQRTEATLGEAVR